MCLGHAHQIGPRYQINLPRANGVSSWHSANHRPLIGRLAISPAQLYIRPTSRKRCEAEQAARPAKAQRKPSESPAEPSPDPLFWNPARGLVAKRRHGGEMWHTSQWTPPLLGDTHTRLFQVRACLRSRKGTMVDADTRARVRKAGFGGIRRHGKVGHFCLDMSRCRLADVRLKLDLD